MSDPETVKMDPKSLDIPINLEQKQKYMVKKTVAVNKSKSGKQFMIDESKSKICDVIIVGANGNSFVEVVNDTWSGIIAPFYDPNSIKKMVENEYINKMNGVKEKLVTIINKNDNEEKINDFVELIKKTVNDISTNNFSKQVSDAVAKCKKFADSLSLQYVRFYGDQGKCIEGLDNKCLPVYEKFNKTEFEELKKYNENFSSWESDTKTPTFNCYFWEKDQYYKGVIYAIKYDARFFDKTSVKIKQDDTNTIFSFNIKSIGIINKSADAQKVTTVAKILHPIKYRRGGNLDYLFDDSVLENSDENEYGDENIDDDVVAINDIINNPVNDFLGNFLKTL